MHARKGFAACGEAFSYEQGAVLVCPMCGHEYTAADGSSDDGDPTTEIPKVKGGGGGVIKVGTKVRGIRLITDGVGDHDIDASVPGFGRMQLKSSVVKKV